MKNTHFRYSIFLICIIILASCHSRRAVLKGEPGEVVKPQPSVAEKYASILGISPHEITNGRLYAFIDQWMGTPYKFGGQDKTGIDCSGFSQLLEQQVYGINIPRTTAQQVKIIKRKYEEELTEGDLIFYDFDGKKFSHVGVYLQNGYLVHASVKYGVIIIKLQDGTMYKHFSRGGSIVPTESQTLQAAN